jgi:hypothetical protein
MFTHKTTHRTSADVLPGKANGTATSVAATPGASSANKTFIPHTAISERSDKTGREANRTITA